MPHDPRPRALTTHPSPERRAGCTRRHLNALALVSLTALAGCASTRPPAGVTVVAPFDVKRYEGRWYELARLDHRFERGLSQVSATYTLQPDGSVKVVNRGFDAAAGRWREATGRALFTGSTSTGSLKVSFFGPFYGGYHVAALSPEYQWSLVVGPDLGYCWILARERHLSATQREAIVNHAKALGVATEALIWVEHGDYADPRDRNHSAQPLF